MKTLKNNLRNGKKENDIGNVSAVDNRSDNFQPKYPFIFKKTYYHGYLMWLSSLGFLGLHHLYLQNWAILLGHILTCGGCGVMWIADFFLMPKFVKYGNEKLGLNEPSDNTNINTDNNIDKNDNNDKKAQVISNIQNNDDNKEIKENDDEKKN